MAIARRLFSGAALQTTLSSSISSGDTTIQIVADTGWPSGAEEFFVVIDPDQANEEKVLVTRSTTTLTAASTAKRGVDGTVAAAHSAGAVIYPCVTATDLDEANGFVSTLTTKGDLLVQGSSDVGRLPVGSNNQMLVADSAQSLGVKWVTPPAIPDLGDLGDVDLAGLADGDVIRYDSASGDWLPGFAVNAFNTVTATTSTTVTVSTQTYTDSTLTATITPSSTSSKILICVIQPVILTNSFVSAVAAWRIMRDSTEIARPANNSFAGIGISAPLVAELIALRFATF
jgi:hypothetical protein